MWMKFTRSMTFRICHYGSLAKLRPHIRNVSQGFSYLDSRIHSIQPLCCRSPLLAGHASITLTVGLQPRRTITTDRPSWYESVADSTPVYLTEQLLNSAQQMTGLPWWASIMHDAGSAYRYHSPPGNLSVHHHCKGLARHIWIFAYVKLC